ncbi:MAG: tetratricopeptide repeat protein [Nitrospirae bacterium]|nr:tetratricopeptide repeat protein [Nitrospirota bacterium]
MFLKNDTKIKVIALLIASLTFLVYLPALKNGFVNWDDQLNVYENPYIRALDLNLLKYMFSFQDTMWIPITRLSHALNYAVWGLDPMGHHLTNIVFHGFNTFLVVILVIRLMEKPGFSDPAPGPGSDTAYIKNTLIAGGLTGILFGIHPLRVESVAWVTERKDVLSCFFMLLSLLYYLKFVSISLKKKRRLYYVLSLVFFVMAMMSKPIAVTLPVILVILDIYPLESLNFKAGLKSGISVIKEKIPFLALSLTLSIVTLVSYESEGITVTKLDAGFIDRLLISVRTLCFYPVKILWPVNLAPMYPYPSKVSFFAMEYIAALILFLAISAFCVYKWKRNKIWSAVWLFYIATLLPVLGIIKFGYFAAADRYTYLPGLGPFLLISLGITSLYGYFSNKNLLQLRKYFLFTVFILTVCALSILTIQQIKIWESSISLWSAQINRFPDSHLGHMNLADAYVRDGNYQQAIVVFNKIEELYPSDPDNYFNRGIAYGTLGLHEKAIEDFKKAIKLSHQNAKYYNELGIAYGSLGNYLQAVDNLNEAVKLDPELAKAYYYRGMAYKSLGINNLFIVDFRRAAQLGHKKAQDYLSAAGIK